MNIQEIDKWLDNEYGCSYTRLEELHDFVVEQDLKHREEKDKEIERLNNIIDKAIKECEQDVKDIWKWEGAYMEMFEAIADILKGSDKK